MTNTITARRLALRANGYSPIPVLGKKALLPEWQKKSGASAEEVTRWEPRYPAMTNTGLLTVDTPTSDSDITIPEVADAFEDFARNWFDGRGELLCRFGNAPRRAFPFRTLKPFRKITAKYKAPDGTFHKIEFLGDGQQIVVDGTHPDTKKPYEWARGRSPLTTPWQNLPEIDEAEVHAFLEAAGKMLHERFGFEPAAPVNNGHIVAGAPVNIEQRLKDMVYRGPEDRSIHQTQLQCIGALLRNNTRLDDAVAMVLEATRQAVANDPSWNWQEEEHNLIRMGFDLITKAPELAPCLNDPPDEMWQAATARCGPGERVSTSIRPR